MIELASSDEERLVLFRLMSCLYLESWPRETRVNGEIECRWCHKPYRQHPRDKDYPFLVVDCDGNRLKL